MVFLVCAVNCKTYYCFGNVKDKFSCKFVNKKNILINKEKYLDVVLSKHSGSGVNRKFKVLNNKICTHSYFQEKNAFSYFI